jgi:hypothetical protein
MKSKTAPKLWRATVNLDRLEAATGRWRITTGAAKDPLPREVASDPAVCAAIAAWMAAHSASRQPPESASAELREAIKTSVTSAFRALPPGTVLKAPAPPAPPRRREPPNG